MRDDMINREHGPGFRGWHGDHNPAGPGPHMHGRPGFRGGPHMRGRGHGPFQGGDNPWGDFFAGGHGGPGHRPDGRARGRDRMERGMLRYVILDVLSDGPKHGYEIIKVLEEHTGGRYSPSPGTLYPTLQYMEDLGLVRSNQEADRRVYQITEAGTAELKEHAGFAESFWTRFREHAPSGAGRHELKFLSDALGDLVRTVKGGIRAAVIGGDPETIRNVRMALERCENEVREIITESATDRRAARSDAEGAGNNPEPGEA